MHVHTHVRYLESVGMMSTKRVKFDPVLERRKVRRQSDAIRAVMDIVQDFSVSVQTVMGELPDLGGADQVLKDLILVMALGGMNGANTLAMATSTVSEHFSDQIGYIQRIVNAGANKEFSIAQIQFLVSLFDSNYVLPCREEYMPMLRKVSEATSVVHTAFLAPPVSKCTMPECQGAALSRPHPPITATIFTVNSGPLPALKCCLRCSKCGTIYNYSMYGRKKQGGERYYDEPRKYVEVSDVVYCERQLFSFYCLLR